MVCKALWIATSLLIANNLVYKSNDSVFEDINRPEQQLIQCKEKMLTEAIDHALWDDLLHKYVDQEGNVDYKNLKNEINILEDYLAMLSKNVPDNTSTKNDSLVFYINLYNAATVKLILDNYPLKSIKNIKKPWAKKWISLGDNFVSLGHIEHKVLRKMNEPRIHFAINCASYSCPKLLNEAFIPSKLEAQLELLTKAFINDSKRNTISKDQLKLSNIFKWYKKDFTASGSLVAYIDAYTTQDISSAARITFIKYNWNLNESN